MPEIVKISYLMKLRELFRVNRVLIVHSKNYFFHCKKCDNDWFII